MKQHRTFFVVIFRFISIFIFLSTLLVSNRIQAVASNGQPSPWAENDKLTASDHTSGDKFGWSVSIDGNIAIIGATGGLSDPGAAYIFTRSGAAWSQSAKLTASDGAGGDEFGASVAVAGNTVVVGAPGDNTDEGAAYVFTESGGVWSEVAKLTASTGNSNDNFGSSVSINGDVIVIGAPSAANYASWGTGRAFVFVKQGTGWTTQTESALLEADYGINSFLHNGDEFGRSVAVSGDTIVVGAPEVNLNGSNSGLVYIFEKPVGGWTGTLNDDANIYPKVPNASDVYVHFGFSVDIDDEIIAAGAYGDTLNNGRAYLFEKGSGWTTGASNRAAELSASDIAFLDEFGYAVSLDGNVAAVGSPWDDGNGANNSGSIYLFEEPDSGWADMIETEKVTASDGAENDYSGRALSASNTTVIAGAPFHDLSGPGSEGAAYIFKSPPSIIINEVDADTPGTDSAEFIELYDGGIGNTDLDELVLVFYNGDDDQSYNSFDLDGYTTDSNGYFVLCGDTANVANCDYDVSPNTNLLQNGPEAVALYMGNGADFPNDTPITTTNLIDVIVYDTNDADDAGLLPLLNTGQPQIDEDGNGNKDNESNQRCPNGTGGKRNTDSYQQATPSPGEGNVCLPEMDVQGNSVSIANNDSVPDTADHTDFGGAFASGGTVTRTFTIENSGTNPLTITLPISIGGTHSGDFLVTGQPASTVSALGGTTTFTVEFDPDAIGVRSAEISIDNNDSDENPYTFAIQGTGIADSIIINEVDADTAGTDTQEFIELYDGGSGNTSLNGLVIVFYNGLDNKSYYAIDLDGASTNADGYFVIGNAAVPNIGLIFGNNILQNGTDAVALYIGDSTNFPNDTSVTTTNLIDAIIYETNDGDAPGLRALLNSGQPIVNETVGPNSDLISNQRCPNGTGGERNTDTYGQFLPTPGERNCPPEINLERPAGTTIADSGTDAQGNKRSSEQVTLTYTVSNTGNSTLTVSDIVATGESSVSVSTITPTSFTVVSGSTETFDVIYTPAAGSGAFSFDLDITNDDPDEGNYNITVSGTRDGDAPTVTIEQGSTQADPTNASPIIFDVAFSESVTGFDDSDVDISGMAAIPTISVTGTGTTYTVEVSGMADGETITATIPANAAQDTTGNDSAASSSTDNSVTYDNTAPTVLYGANTLPENASSLTSGPTEIQVEFSENVTTASAEDRSNYLLLGSGTNGSFDTTSCATGTLGDDLEIIINNASYNGTDPFFTTLTINDDIPLPIGVYRLFICGTTSIEDLAGIHLNDGTDSLLDFTVVPASMPKTGFRHGRVTQLPEQPAANAYADTVMTLEIPSLGVTMPIVGVPQTQDGWDITWLGNSAGYLAGSAFPTWAGNTVITGHVWDAYNQPGAFAELKTLQYGDQIQIHAWGVTYTYEVRESKLITKKNTSAVFQSEQYDWITLVTCEFYNPFNGEYLFRRAVRAVLVSVD